MHVNPTNVSKWKHHWWVHNRDVVWDTHVSTWAGEGEIFRARDVDAPHPKKDEVIVALLKMTRQPTEHLLKKDAGVPSPKPWELDPMVLDARGRRGDPGGDRGCQRPGRGMGGQGGLGLG